MTYPGLPPHQRAVVLARFRQARNRLQYCRERERDLRRKTGLRTEITAYNIARIRRETRAALQYARIILHELFG